MFILKNNLNFGSEASDPHRLKYFFKNPIINKNNYVKTVA